VAADYTRNIVFNVNDKAIKRATDRITRSLTNIEKTLQRIERKGFNNLAKSAEKASKQVFTTTDSIRVLEQRTKNLGKVGKDLVNTYGQSFQRINKVGLNPFNDILRDTVGSFKLITFAAKRSGQDLRTIFEFFNKGRLDIISFTTAIGAAITGVKNFGTSAKTNLTLLGSLLDANNKKAQTFVSTLLLGSQMGGKKLPLTADPNILAINTAIARQNSMRGNVLRNTIRSERSRTGSDFLDFSIGADQIPRVIGSRGRPANMQGPDRPGIQDPIAKSIRRNQAKRDKLLQRELRIRQNILKVQQQSLAVSKSELQTTSGNAQGFIGPRLPRGFRLKQQFAPGGAFFNNRGAAGRFASAGQSALIGGAFPLLFGQGGLGAAAGGIGGAIGGALSPGLGFGLSIAGTAIAQRIQETIDFQEAVEKLNISIKATGGTSLLSSKQVREFGKSLGLSKDEALEALKAFKQFDAAARITLTTVFGKEQTFDTLTGLKNNQSILNALPGLSKELSLDQAKAALEVLKSKNAREAESFILDGIINKQRTVTKEEAKRLNFFQRQLSKLNPFKGRFVQRDPNNFFAGGSFMDMDQSAEFRGQKAEKSFDQKVNEALQLLDIQKEFNNELERQAIIKAPVDELNKLLDPLRQIDSLSKSIGDSFAESFKGIVSGSMTAQEALRNLFQRTADHFIDMAAQILAAQVRAGIMGLFSRAFSGGIFSGGGSAGANNIAFGSQNLGINTASNFPGFADGGRPPVGRASIVGERGPELFVPDRTGTIIPNNQLSGMGGSTSIVINVDASGSSVEGDEEQANAFGSAIATAIQSELIKQKRPGGLLA